MNTSTFQAIVAVAVFSFCFPWVEAETKAVLGRNPIKNKIKETLKNGDIEWEDNPLRWILEGAILHHVTFRDRDTSNGKGLAASISLGGNGHNTLISLLIEAAKGRKIKLFVGREATEEDHEERFKDEKDPEKRRELIQMEIKKNDNPLTKHCKVLLDILISMKEVSCYKQPAGKEDNFNFTAIFGNTDEIDFGYDGYCGTGPSGKISKKAKGHLEALKYLEGKKVEILDVDVKSFLTAYLTPGHEDKGLITTPKQAIAINYFKGTEVDNAMQGVKQSLGMPKLVFDAIRELAKDDANHINLDYRGYMSTYDEKLGKITVELLSDKNKLVELLTERIGYQQLPAFA